MSQPPVYSRQADLTSYQTNNPGQPMSGSDLDNEFEAVKATLDAIRANLALLQRDDTQLKNAVVHPDALNTATLALIAGDWTPQGLWVTATAYVVGDIVEEAATSYVCAEAHTSGTFSTDQAAGKWVVLGYSQSVVQSGSSVFAAAGGTADVMTLALTPTAESLSDGQELRVRAVGANTVTGVTINIDSLGAKTVKRLGNQALLVGDIPRAGYEMQLRYNSSNDVFELLNPAILVEPASADLAKSALRLQVDGLSALQALSNQASGERVYLTYRSSEGDGAQGMFRWDGSDLSTEVAADEVTVGQGDGGIYVAPASDKTGASGAYVRESGWSSAANARAPLNVAWYGLDGTVAGDTAGIQAAINAAPNDSVITFAGVSVTVNELTISSKTNIEIRADGAHVSLDYGTNYSIFNVSGCEEIEIHGFRFTGTSDSSSTYDAVNRHQGVYITTSSFIDIHHCVFEKFSSFGIFAQSLNGGVYTEGLNIHHCVFRDFPYDATTQFQCGVLLSTDGEYSEISHNRFFRVPSAARFTDGANSMFTNNIVMQCNGGYGTDRACVYQDVNSNSGKLNVSNNKFNHNETGEIILFLKNDPTKPQNTCIVHGNEFLVNGLAGSHSQQVVLSDYPSSRVTNNSFRPAAVIAGEECLRLNTCDDAIVDSNYFRGADYAITANNCTPAIGHNVYDTLTTGKVQLAGTGDFKVFKNRAYALRIAAAGTAGTPWDKSGWTVTNPATGRYTVTHNMGTNNYSVAVELDNDATATERSFSVVRSTNTFDIYVATSAAAAVNDDLLVTVTLGINSEAALD